MKIKKWIIGVLLLFPLTLAATSCIGGVPPNLQQVFVSPKDLKEGTITQPGPNQEAVPILISQVPDGKIREALVKLFPGEDTIVLTTREHVKPAVPDIPAILDDPNTPNIDESKPAVPGHSPVVVPITAPTDEQGNVNFGEWASQAFPAIASLVPTGFAPWLPLLGYVGGLFARKRPRQHLADTASALNPLQGGTVNVKAAVSSLGKAIGYTHSLDTPAQLRAIADKIEAEAVHDEKIEILKETV